jgi:hypothetical protein
LRNEETSLQCEERAGKAQELQVLFATSKMQQSTGIFLPIRSHYRMRFSPSILISGFALSLFIAAPAVYLQTGAISEPAAKPVAVKSKSLFQGCRTPFCQSSHAQKDEGCDPKPPQVLQVVSQPVADDGGDLTIDVTVLPNPYATVQLITPNSPRLSQTGGKVGLNPKALARGATESQTLKLRYDDSGQSEELLFTVLLRNDEGEIFAEVTEVVKVNPTAVAEGAMEERVAVIFETGGRKIVQYVPRSEALERGLIPVENPATGKAPPPEEKTE